MTTGPSRNPTKIFDECPHRDFSYSQKMAWSMGYNEAQSAAIASETAISHWQTIDTAPKDGTHILTYSSSGVEEAWWKDQPGLMDVHWGGKGWWYSWNSLPTHWMPMPTPPERPEGK